MTIYYLKGVDFKLSIFTKLNSYNYLVPIYLYAHYIFGYGTDIQIELDKDVKFRDCKFSPVYLALGHFNYDNHEDIYDFNEGEWPDWFIKFGIPFTVKW